MDDPLFFFFLGGFVEVNVVGIIGVNVGFVGVGVGVAIVVAATFSSAPGCLRRIWYRRLTLFEKPEGQWGHKNFFGVSV